MAIPFFMNEEGEGDGAVGVGVSRGANAYGDTDFRNRSGSTSTTIQVVNVEAPAPRDGRMKIQVIFKTAKPTAAAVAALRRRSSTSTNTVTVTCDCDKPASSIINSSPSVPHSIWNHNQNCNTPSQAVAPPDTSADSDSDPDGSFRDIGRALREIADSYKCGEPERQEVGQEAKSLPPRLHSRPRSFWGNQLQSAIGTSLITGGLLGLGIFAFTAVAAAGAFSSSSIGPVPGC